MHLAQRNLHLGQHTLTDQTANSKSGRLPNRSEMEQFKAYVDTAHLQNGGFSPEMKAAIELMHELNTKGGSLELYEGVSK